jgi:hypothetical protein
MAPASKVVAEFLLFRSLSKGQIMFRFKGTKIFTVFLASVLMLGCLSSCVQRRLNEATHSADNAPNPTGSESNACELKRRGDSGLAAFKNFAASVAGKFPDKKVTGACLTVALVASLYATPLLANTLLPAEQEPCAVATAGGDNLRQLDGHAIEVFRVFERHPRGSNSTTVPTNIEAKCELPGDVVPVMPDRSKEKVARLELARIVTAHALVGLKAMGTSDQKLAAKYLLHYLMGSGKPLDVSRDPAVAADVVEVFMSYYQDFNTISSNKPVYGAYAPDDRAISNTIGRFYLYYDLGAVKENGKRMVTLRIDDAYIWPKHYMLFSDSLVPSGNSFPSPFVDTLRLIMGPYSDKYFDKSGGSISNLFWNDMKREGNKPGAARDFNMILNTEFEI